MTNEAPEHAELRGDGCWLERFRRGDRSLLSEIYHAHFTRVRRAVSRVLGEPADQDNVVQQLFADLVESAHLRRNYDEGDFAAWLCAIARHRAIDFGRRQARLVTIDDAEIRAGALHQPDAPLRDFRSDLERFALTLPLERQRVLKLRFIEGLTQVETAQQLGVPRSTLEDWERHIKADLRAFLLGGGRSGRNS